MLDECCFTVRADRPWCTLSLYTTDTNKTTPAILIWRLSGWSHQAGGRGGWDIQDVSITEEQMSLTHSYLWSNAILLSAWVKCLGKFFPKVPFYNVIKWFPGQYKHSSKLKTDTRKFFRWHLKLFTLTSRKKRAVPDPEPKQQKTVLSLGGDSEKWPGQMTSCLKSHGLRIL